MCFRGSLDSELTQQLHHRFMGLVEANERNSKNSTSSISSSSSYRAEVPKSQVPMNGAVTDIGQRDSLLSSYRSPSTSADTSAVSPLTGNRLLSHAYTEEVASPRVGNHLSSPTYSNGLASESPLSRYNPSSSTYSSRVTAPVSPFSRFDSTNDSLAARVTNGGVGMSMSSCYRERSPDVATSSYSAKSRLDDASSPAARLQSLRDSYTATMWNDCATSRRDRMPSGGWGGVDSPTTPTGLSRLTLPYDADPTTELLNETTPTSSRYERVMSARSSMRRGDVKSAAATRRITSPVAAARLAMNDLTDAMLSLPVEQPAAPAPVRSTPLTALSRTERMKLYGVGATPNTHVRDTLADTDPAASSPPTRNTTDSGTTITHDMTPPTQAGTETSSLNASMLVNGTDVSSRTEILQMPAANKSDIRRDMVADSSKTVTENGDRKSPSSRMSSRTERIKSYGVRATSRTDPHDKTANTTLSAVSPPTSNKAEASEQQPAYQDDTTSSTKTSEPISLKSSTLVDGREMPPRTDILHTVPTVNKSDIHRDMSHHPAADSSKNATMNGGRKSPEHRESRPSTTTSTFPAGYKNAKNCKLDSSSNGLETTTSEVKSTSDVTLSETDRSRKTDADDIAGSSLSAATLNKLQTALAAAAAANAAVSTTVPRWMEAIEETSASNVKKTPSSSERCSTTTENGDSKGGSTNVTESLSASSSRNSTSRARSRAPSTLQEMLIPSSCQENAKSISSAKSNDAARSGSGRKVNGAPPPSSDKATKSGDSASKSSAAKGDSAVKSRSRMLANVHEMLVPSSSGGGKTEQASAKITSTSNSTTASTSIAKTTPTSSKTAEKKSGSPAPAKSSPQTSRRQAPSSDATARSGSSTMADRNSARRPSTSSAFPQQTTVTPASKATRPAKEAKTTRKTTSTVEEVSTAAAMKVDEEDWKMAVVDAIKATVTARPLDDDGAVSEASPTPSLLSLQSEPPPSLTSRTRNRSTSGDVLSSLMRPTASSLRRRGSTSGATGQSARRTPSYAAPTSSSASKSTSASISRTASSPALRVAGGSLSLPNRATATGTASGRTTPTGARRAVDHTASQTPARVARPPPRPGTTTNTSQRAAGGQSSSRSRTRHNSNSSSSGDAVTGRKWNDVHGACLSWAKSQYDHTTIETDAVYRYR